MDHFTHNVELTSAEIANLWIQYMNDSLSICILTHSIDKPKDEEIKELLEIHFPMQEKWYFYFNEIYVTVLYVL